jgi:hypothetical protein
MGIWFAAIPGVEIAHFVSGSSFRSPGKLV